MKANTYCETWKEKRQQTYVKGGVRSNNQPEEDTWLAKNSFLSLDKKHVSFLNTQYVNGTADDSADDSAHNLMI